MNLARWVGIPYGFQGRALDCWSLCRAFARKELGQEFPEFMFDKSDEEAYLEAGRIHIATQAALGTHWRPVSEPDVGDVLLIRIKGHPCHCGIFVGPVDGVPTFLHTLKGRNSSLESLTFWKQQIDAAYRYHPA